jgi:DNA (cytosine-5)-methyltransferase 1
MKYFSTFTGIGGFELGIQQAYEIIRNSNVSQKRAGQKTKEGKLQENGKGLHTLSTKTTLPPKDRDNELSDRSIDEGQLTCIGYSEIDKYAIGIYQKHFPEHKNYGDITKIKAEDLPDFDLLCGGFPCQSFSIAGKRGGFDDTRGTMFFELARIARIKKPRLLLFENVKGLLSHDEGKTFATIISTLDELGYDIQWQVLNSKNFGVPQNRERVFIVGHLRGTARPKVFPFTGTDSEDIKANQGRESGIFPTIRATHYKSGDNQPLIRQLNNPNHSNERVYGKDGISPTLNTMQGGLRQPKVLVPEAIKGGYSEATVGDSINLSQINSKTRRGRVGKGVAQTLDTGMHQHTLMEGLRIRRLTPIECERLQGFPDRWTELGSEVVLTENGKLYWKDKAVSDTQRYKCCGNAVTVNVVSVIMEKLLK